MGWLTDLVRFLASWHAFTEWELILVLSAGAVLAVLVLNFLVDAGLELWSRVISIHGGPHAVDSVRIHRETAREVERLAGRAAARRGEFVAGADRGVDASRDRADRTSVLGHTAAGSAEGQRFLEAMLVDLHRDAPGVVLDRRSEYGISTSLVLPAPKKRVVDPWLVGRDLV